MNILPSNSNPISVTNKLIQILIHINLLVQDLETVDLLIKESNEAVKKCMRGEVIDVMGKNIKVPESVARLGHRRLETIRELILIEKSMSEKSDFNVRKKEELEKVDKWLGL